MMRRISLFLAFAKTAATDIYISNNGSDNAAGTDASHPWKSFANLVNVTFSAGDALYLQAGDKWCEQLVMLGDNTRAAGMRGSFDGLSITRTNASVAGWAVNSLLSGGGIPPVTVRIAVDGTFVTDDIAKLNRPDLPKAGVAPNPEHGFFYEFDAQIVSTLQKGNHTISASAIVTTNIENSKEQQLMWPLPGGPFCICDGVSCECKSPPAPTPQLPVTLAAFVTAATTNSKQRPVIKLDGKGAGISTLGVAWLDVSGIEVRDATQVCGYVCTRIKISSVLLLTMCDTKCVRRCKLFV